MYADNISIDYWNQNKTQYGTTEYSSYKSQTSYNRNAIQQDFKSKESATYSESDALSNKSDSVIKLGSWLGTLILLILPGINIISIITLAISSKSPSKKSFARAILLLSLILITLVLIFMVLTCDKFDYVSLIDTIPTICYKILGISKRLF